MYARIPHADKKFKKHSDERERFPTSSPGPLELTKTVGTALS